MEQRYFCLYIINLNPAKKEDLRDYEKRVKPTLEKHGGKFEMILEPYIPGLQGPSPGEIHLISFANPQGLKDFKGDPEMEANRLERGDIVNKVDLIPCHQIPVDQYFGD